jgi:hypothetical protein
MTPEAIASRVQRTVMLQHKKNRTCGEIIELARNKLWVRWRLLDELLELEGKSNGSQGAERVKR